MATARVAPRFDPPLSRCPLCHAPTVHAYDRDYLGISIARCESCGIKFMNPQYSDAYLAEYYASYIREELDSLETQRERREWKSDKIALVERFVARGRFLSIGSGDGAELVAAQTRGWQVEGYDVDAATTARIAAKVGVPLYTGDLFSLPLASDVYDCVFLDQVLEHPKNPGDYLRLCHRVLARDGVLFLGVPNIASMSSAFKTATGKAGLKRRRGKHYDTMHHLFYYSPATLPPLLEREYGFRVLLVRGDPTPNRSGSPLIAARDALIRRLPQLDSSFVILARPRK